MEQIRTASDEIDRLTRTFSTDRAYCDALFNSGHASLVAEILLSHLWANNALPICYRALADAVPKRFGAEQKDRAGLWNLILLDGAGRDLRIMPYLVLRGLGPEASAALRRAFEHAGVLTQIWTFPDKVDALEDTDSRQYDFAFRREANQARAAALKSAKNSKRFAAMKSGEVATSLYDMLSTFDVHGGTSRRFFAYSTKPSKFSCNLCSRLDPDADETGRHLALLANGHRAVCGELMCLCADHGTQSDDLILAAEAFKMFACVAGEPTTDLAGQIRDLLKRLGLQQSAAPLAE
jgi:hypothetical protein